MTEFSAGHRHRHGKVASMTAPHWSGSDQPLQEVTIDDGAQAAYIRIHRAPVGHTRPFDDDEAVILDFSADGTLIGIEVLGLNTAIPIDELARAYHFPAPLIAALRSIQETLRSTAVTTASYPGSLAAPAMCTG